MHEFINKLSLMYNLEYIKNFKKKKIAQCSHFRSMAEVSFLPSANIRKRVSRFRAILKSFFMNTGTNCQYEIHVQRDTDIKTRHRREDIFLCWVGHTLCNVP